MRITTEVTTVVLVDGVELSGDKFHVEYKDGTTETFKNTSAVEVLSWLEDEGTLDDVVFFCDC